MTHTLAVPIPPSGRRGAVSRSKVWLRQTSIDNIGDIWLWLRLIVLWAAPWTQTTAPSHDSIQRWRISSTGWCQLARFSLRSNRQTLHHFLSFSICPSSVRRYVQLNVSSYWWYSLSPLMWCCPFIAFICIYLYWYFGLYILHLLSGKRFNQVSGLILTWSCLWFGYRLFDQSTNCCSSIMEKCIETSVNMHHKHFLYFYCIILTGVVTHLNTLSITRYHMFQSRLHDSFDPNQWKDIQRNGKEFWLDTHDTSIQTLIDTQINWNLSGFGGSSGSWRLTFLVSGTSIGTGTTSASRQP